MFRTAITIFRQVSSASSSVLKKPPPPKLRSDLLSQSKSILLSSDFRDGKGGISRVARTLDEVLSFSSVVSYHGQDRQRDGRSQYCDGNRSLFVARALPAMRVSPPDLIFCDHADVSVVPAMFKHRNSRLVIFLHDEEAWGPLTHKRRIGLSQASRLICNSEYTRRRFLASHPEYERFTRTCLLGGTPRAFAQSPTSVQLDPWLLDPTPFALFVSRLWREHRYKGHLELLDAFALLRRGDGPRLRLAIIGSGSDAKTVEDRIRSLGLGEDVRLFSNVDDGLLQEFYKRALVFILPSTREGFGLVFLEAMASGTPCIAVRDQPAEEIIEHGVSGLLLPNNSPAAIAATLDPIRKDPTSIRHLAEAAKCRYETHFTQSAFRLRLELALEGMD